MGTVEDGSDEIAFGSGHMLRDVSQCSPWQQAGKREAMYLRSGVLRTWYRLDLSWEGGILEKTHFQLDGC